MRADIQDALEARGAFAFLRGAPRDGNPFKEDTDQHVLWDNGWLENENSPALQRHLSRTCTFGSKEPGAKTPL